jgi:hypothetical protein
MSQLIYWMHWTNWREGEHFGDSDLFSLEGLYFRSDPETLPSDLQCPDLSS